VASRREFLRQLSWAAVPLAATSVGRQDSALKTQGKGAAAADTLAFPVGPNLARVGPLDNDPTIIAIERRLKCTCGCMLDVYTCRTTDFICTVSPAMHQDVIAQFKAGAKPEEIIQAFVAKNGETVLMAPAARGFNLMGYLVPGLTVTALGLVLAAWLSRKRVTPDVAASGQNPAVAATPDAEQLAELKRALDDVEA